MKRVLVVNPKVAPPGGGECVAAWAIQALRERYAVSVLAFEPPDVEALNEYYGTSLQPGDFSYLAPRHLGHRLARLLPLRLVLLHEALLQGEARRVMREARPDLAIGFYSEMDVGIRAIQYVHFPTFFEPRSDADRWFHWGPFVWLYRRAALALGRVSRDRARRNLALVNSAFTAQSYAVAHGVKPVILYPPVPPVGTPRPWKAREDAFVCAGRISPEKRIEAVIGTLAEVRRRGHDVRLHVVGAGVDPDYARALDPLYARHRDWVRVEGPMPRSEYARLLTSVRYGIHGMQLEHFGISVAEMQRAGCVVFAPDAGGPTEILDGDPRLLVKSDADAVDKIVRVLEDAALQEELHEKALARSARYSSERFSAELLDHVEAFLAGDRPPR